MYSVYFKPPVADHQRFRLSLYDLEADLAGILPGTREREVLEKMVAEGDPTNKLG